MSGEQTNEALKTVAVVLFITIVRARTAHRSSLKHRLLYVWALLAISLLTFSRLPRPALAAQDASGRYVISQTVNLVELPVTVKDRKGRFVSGLEKSNFQVYEDGKAQEITLFQTKTFQ